MSFANQVAVITGASSGIGWALAKELAKRGCHLGLLARREPLLQQLAVEIRGLGQKAEIAVADVTQRQPTVEAIHLLRQKLGPIDLLIANSGFGRGTPLQPLDIDLVEQMFHVNLFGTIYALEAVLPEMLERGKGHLAAISSLAAYKGMPGESAYCASKAAVFTYMEGLRIQLRSLGIAVTTICPGFVDTPMISGERFPKPWIMSPEKAALKIVNALEKKKKVYNFPLGTTLLMKATRWLPDWVVEKFFRNVVKDRKE